MIRVVLPAHLRMLARIDGEVRLDVAGPVTQRSVLVAPPLRFYQGSTREAQALGDGRNDIDGRHAVLEEEFICHSSM